MENLIGAEQFESLLAHREPGSISLFMPTRTAGAETRENRIRLKNLLGRAEEQLAETGMRKPDARDRVGKVRYLLNDAGFWRHQSSGLALFLYSGPPRIHRVPIFLEELVTTSDRFHLRPLLPMTAEATFFLLALSRNSVRLFHCTRFGIREMELPDTPKRFEEVMSLDAPEHHLEFHTGTPARGPGGERRSAVFHDQGEAVDEAQAKRKVADFCHMVDAGVCRALAGRTEPLVLAAADPTLGLYREANDYDRLFEEAIHESPDRIPPRELHQQAWKLVEPVFQERRRRDAGRYHDLAGKGWTADEPRSVVRAAHVGQIEAVFVDSGAHQWGRFDPDSQEVELHDAQQGGDDDLLDLAAVRTFIHAGRVHVVRREEMPSGSPVAALLRFPMSS